MTKEMFMRRSCEIHGDIYDYSESDYVNTKTKVKIHCRKHNVDFMQTPEKHMRGQTGCRQCANERIKETNLQKYGVTHPMQSEAIKAKTKRTNLKMYGVENPAQAKSIQDKMKQTNLDRYGCEYAIAANTVRSKINDVFNEKYNGNSPFSSESVRDKAKVTISSRYGVQNVLLLADMQKRIKQTNRKKFGTEYPLQADCIQKKIEETNMKRYGVKRPFSSSAIQEKVKSTIFDKYGVDNVMKSSDVRDKIAQTNLQKYGSVSPLGSYSVMKKAKQTCLEKYGCEYAIQSNTVKERMIQTKRKNNSFHTSKPEDELYAILIAKFGTDDVIRQYCSDAYPFACDFYVKTIDTYIELNAFWTHGDHFFDENDPDDIAKLNTWKTNAMNNLFYKRAIYNWTVHDIKKRNTALKNNLNYVVFWNNDLTDAIEWLSTV